MFFGLLLMCWLWEEWCHLPATSIEVLSHKFMVLFLFSVGCEFFPIGEYLRFVRIPENFPVGERLLRLKIQNKQNLSLDSVDKVRRVFNIFKILCTSSFESQLFWNWINNIKLTKFLFHIPQKVRTVNAKNVCLWFFWNCVIRVMWYIVEPFMPWV